MFKLKTNKPLATMVASAILACAVGGLTTGVANAAQCHPTELQGKVKWQPGHYMRIIYHKYKKNSLSAIDKFLSNPNSKGLVLEVRWRSLEKARGVYDFSPIDEVKDLVEARGKKLSIKLMERCFAGCDPKLAGPDYIMAAGGIVGLYKNQNGSNGKPPVRKGGIVRIWEKQFADRFIALYNALGKRYDLDDTIVGITIGAGESALAVLRDSVRLEYKIDDISSGYNEGKHLEQLRRITTAAKQVFKHTIAYTGVNFLPGGEKSVTKLLNEAEAIGGGGVVHPDTIPPAPNRRKFYHYDVEKGFINDIAIFPQFQTALVPLDLTEAEMYEFARDQLQANAIGWNESFFARTKETRPNYITDYVLPEVNKNNGRLNNKCPSSFANGCITIAKCTGQKTTDPNPVILPGLTGFSLINASNDAVLGALKDGDTINLATLASRELNIAANAGANPVGSVSFVLAGRENHATTENAAPYSLFGDAGGDYLVWKPALGSYTLSATAYAEKNAAGDIGNTLSVNFTVIDKPVSSAFKQGSGSFGIVNIPANKPHNKTTASGHRWEELAVTDVAGAAGSVMRALPDDDTRINTGYVTNSPRLDYKVNFVKTGTHYVWVRGAATGNDNTIHVGLNGKAVATTDRISIKTSQGFIWSRATLDNADATLNIPATGVSTVNVWMREDGFRLEKILLTIDPNYDPSK